MDDVLSLIERGICPRCGEELHYRTWKEDRGECRGYPAYEVFGEYICEECGYIYT
jgi:predicted RNA-binding Zn-ribbon protein involved in translation (DUF1610 family)